MGKDTFEGYLSHWAPSQRALTLTMPLTGKEPCFFLHNGAVFVEHDCMSRRIAVEVDTRSWFAWQILFQSEDKLIVSPHVSCSACHTVLNGATVSMGDPSASMFERCEHV